MRPPHRSSGSRPHRDSMRPSFRPAGHRPHGPSINPWRPSMNGARPYKSFFQTRSYETRPFLKSSVVKNPYRAPWVPTVNRYVPLLIENFPLGSSQNNIDDKGYWDSGCSRHMTGNISYLSDFEPFDGGYVSFGQGGCKITGNGPIKTGGKVNSVLTVGNKMLKALPLPVISSHCQKTFALLVKKGSPCCGKVIPLLKKIALLMKTRNEHYALWEVIEFGDSYEAPKVVVDTGSASEGSAKKKGKIVAVTTEDMQKRKNDVKARTTLLLGLPNEHQLRFSKYKTAQELWAAILKIFEWLMYTIVWRNRSDLNTMSLDDVYNHLKVYEPKVQKKSESNSQNMAFISSAKNSSGNGEVKTASIPTASTQIKYEDINQIDEDDIEEMDIKCGWQNKLKVECFNYHKMGHFARECRAPRSQDRGRRENFKQGSKVEELAPKALMAIDGVGWDWSYIANKEEDHALVANQEAPIEVALMAKSSFDTEVESKTNRIKSLTNELEMLKKEKEGLDSKLTGFQSVSKDIDTLLGSQRPSPNIESKSNNLQNNSSSVSENGESTSSILSKPEIKFVKAADSPTGNSQNIIDDKGYWDSGCSRHMTGNISYLSDYEPYDGGYVSFGQGGCKNTDESELWHRRLGHLNFKTINRKQHKASCKTKVVNSMTKPLHTLHIDLFGPTFTSGILRNFITEIENLKDLKVKIIRCDNGGEFRNKEMNDFCSRKGIKREFSNARTPQQNGVAERRNKTLIEAAKTMLVDSKLPVTFWAEAVNTACYVQNMVLINKSQNKTSYELFNGRTHALGFLKPFGCHVMILNTLDHLGKFEAKGDEGYFLGYSMSSKAFRVFNKRTKRVEENLHVEFLENKLIKKGAGPNWLFDIDTLTNSMNYVPVVSTGTTSTNFSAHLETSTSNAQDAYKADATESSRNSNPTVTSTNPPADQTETLTVKTSIPTVSLPVPTACLDDSPQLSSDTRLISKRVTSQDDTPSLDNILTLLNRFEDILGATTNSGDTNEVEADLSNMETNISASPTSTLRIHKDHPTSQIIGPVDTPVQTRTKSKKMEEQSFIASIHHMTNPDLLQFFLFLCFLSQEETKKISDSLVDCPKGVKPIGTKWVLKNKKDERGIVIRKKARLVAQRHTQEERIDYKEVFAPVARIEAIRLFLAYASFMGFTVYQMDVKSVFLYGTIDEEVYVMQPPGFQDPEFPTRVYKTLFIRKHRGDFIVDDIIFGSSNLLLCREFKALMHEKFQMSAMGELNFFLGLQVLQKNDGIFLSQDKYGKDRTGKDVDLHLYRSMIRSLMYLTASRPNIMFAVCACARHQVTHKECHLHAVKRIFRYLKGHPKLGVWYPKDPPFDLVAYSDSDYGGATQDRKSTTIGCQFLSRRLISWQCKKNTIMATSTTKAEYVAAASGCEQVLWIQNQLLDYGYNFMNTKIYIDNNSAICIVKNLVYHFRTKHNEIRHHFIRDYFEKKLISVDHIHTEDNVAYRLTKPFDAGRFQYLVVGIGMLNP
uniref:Integrase catalytic domain-containing protein n=1 Tax=Tanacetum cinerariifolium TaxID=118510 RepID=A0A699H9V5_TANCI|nr:hypothetical protein [Tanacetum cinerariifolium]